MNLLKKKVSKDIFFKEYSKILNGVLELSPRELEVFSFLLKEDSVGGSTNINSPKVRKEIIETYKISEANLSRYLRVIKDKGLIIKGQTGKWIINDLVRPIVDNNKFELKFILEVE